jgi:paraquat-inducible protein A
VACCARCNFQLIHRRPQSRLRTLTFSLAAILSPALKIAGLLILSLTLDWPRWKLARTWVYRTIRVIDPWNMLEVFLLAISISMIEMGRVATVHPGRGVFSFTAVVALTLLATLSFDPRLLWDSPEERKRYE